ncbi:Rne/Rng family ribonuclease [Pelagibacteraceae bacterium]|nr:Rne/Rng family ribonuclease [Pelagibacteraceae bacterium]
MEKEILIDASQEKQTRVAIKSDNGVEEYEYENEQKKQLKGNIFLGRISRIEPSLQAAFVDFGNERHGFLAFNDIQTQYYQIPLADKELILKEEEELRKELEEETNELSPEDSNSSNESESGDSTKDTSDEDLKNSEDGEDSSETENPELEKNPYEKKISDIRAKKKFKRYRIQEVIKPGQIILLQIVKEERGKKGAALTTFLSLAGKYIVLMPNTAKGGGISRKIFNSQDRKNIRSIIKELTIPETMGLIVRTAGAKKTQNEIKNDLDVLVQIWEEIKEKTLTSNAPTIIHEEGDVIYRTIRDFFSNDIKEVTVDGAKGFDKAKKYAEIIAKDQVKKIKKYKGKIPLFHSKEIEKYLNQIFEPRINLKSGGYLIINPTEALVAIDINSGRSTKERNIEKTALNTNIEAAVEIARQAKLRDLAGLIVIDFIDMENYSNRRLVEKKLKEALRNDKARVQVGKISNFGLLEMTRQRLRESSIQWKTILSVESFSQKILKLIEEKIFSIPKVKTVEVDLPKKIIDFIQANMKDEIHFFEKKFKFKIKFNANPDFLSEDFKISFKDSKKKELEELKNEEEVAIEEPFNKEKNFHKDTSDSDDKPGKKTFHKKKFRKKKFFKKRTGSRSTETKEKVVVKKDSD